MTRDEEQIVTRILNVLPPNSFELLTFLSLFNVRFSDAVETAAVTCDNAPALLLNRRFVEEHCRTDEHLMMLVMHELYHVILGHTSLFKRATPIRNVVFDAVINAILCSLFPEKAFTSFFTDYYPPDKMPFALLRPRGAGTPPEAESALRLLYDEAGTGTYYDVFRALSKMASVIMVEEGGGLPLPGDVGKGGDKTGKGEEPVLLGSHGEDDDDISPDMKELIDKIIAKWPAPDRPLAGRDQGCGPESRDFGVSPPGRALVRAMRRLMLRASLEGTREARRRNVRETRQESATFLPTMTDRLHEARVMTLGEALVWHTETPVRRTQSRDRRMTYVYLDVSGSVREAVPALARAIHPFFRRGLCAVHVFSTIVAETTIPDLARGHFKTTCGTDIRCVFRHVLSQPRAKRPKSIVVVTDGLTGSPPPEDAAKFRAAGMKMHVGLVEGDAHTERDLAGVAASFVRLTV